jgi:RNA polymerase sigma factor (sigma-70 family)
VAQPRPTPLGSVGPTRDAAGDTSHDAVPRLRLVDADAYPDWEAIYNDNVTWVYRLLFAKVGNRPDAEDLTTEVFLAALKPLRVSASVAEVRSYLLATSRTVLAAHWRRTFGREITAIDLADVDLAAGLPARVATNERATAKADGILARLPERYRRILQLRFLEGRSVTEAAAEMGVSTANAKVLQHRALRRAAETAQTDGKVTP